LAQGAHEPPQSVSTAQPALTAHGAHKPPQSTSLSPLFKMVSTQLAGTQMCCWQRALAQSPLTEQLFPLAHAVPLVPPQSVSVSSPLRVPSLLLAPWHACASHTPLTQSSGP
jgi:hypothetical protein